MKFPTPPARLTQWVTEHRDQMERWLQRLSREPVLSTKIQQTIGMPNAIAVAEESGFCRAVCVDRQTDSNRKSVYRWEITELGRAWLKQREEKAG